MQLPLTFNASSIEEALTLTTTPLKQFFRKRRTNAKIIHTLCCALDLLVGFNPIEQFKWMKKEHI